MENGRWAEHHRQDLQADLQSPSAELLHTLRVGAHVLQKLCDWVGVLLAAYIDVHGQVLKYMKKILSESLFHNFFIISHCHTNASE